MIGVALSGYGVAVKVAYVATPVVASTLVRLEAVAGASFVGRQFVEEIGSTIRHSMTLKSEKIEGNPRKRSKEVSVTVKPSLPRRN